MKSTDKIFVNIDEANFEIERLAKRLGQMPPKFVPKIDDANSKIEQMETELAKKAADVVARPTPKLNVAPKPTDPPAAQPKRKPPQGTGLMRAINSNIVAQGGTPIVTRSKETAEEKVEVTGLQRAIEANIKAQKSKSNE